MLEIRQLKFFAVAAGCSSFSEAAGVLFTSQSNVSKVIAALEEQLGYALFQRESSGILLTSKGRLFYQKIQAVLEGLEELEGSSADKRDNLLRISTNPSSWFARRFSSFYDLHEEENISYNIHTDSTFAIVQRIRKMEDDLGFVYVFPDDHPRLEYELRRYQLRFEQLAETDGMLYFSASDAPAEDFAGNRELTDYKLIQAEHDDYIRRKDWLLSPDGRPVGELPVAITTNSDYIMNIMLKKPRIANISAGGFAAGREGAAAGI
nr:LysR family transcriptional regulator [Lachnospiraceae bacterium]